MNAAIVTPTLTGPYLGTYECIFQQPPSSNLAWRDILSLLTLLGTVVVEPDGQLKATINGQALLLPTPIEEHAQPEELKRLQYFLTLTEKPLSVPKVPVLPIPEQEPFASLWYP